MPADERRAAAADGALGDAPAAGPRAPRAAADDGSGAVDACAPRADPFAALALSPFDALAGAERARCEGCGRSVRYWCGACGALCLGGGSGGGDAPHVRLPLRFEVVQGRGEAAQRSTAGQAAALAPDDVRVWRPWPECAEALQDAVDLRAPSVALLYPRADAVALCDAPGVRTLVVLDASWTSASVLAGAPALAGLRCVRLARGARRSAFWRYAPLRGARSAFNPLAVAGMLSTVEAIHEACMQRDPAAPCDDLLWLFAFQHGRVAAAVNADPAKKRRLDRKSKGLLSDRF